MSAHVLELPGVKL